MKRFCSLLVVLVLGVGLFAGPAAAAPTDVAVGLDVLTSNTSDPIDLVVADDGRVIWVEREGELNVLLPDGTQIKSPRLPVSADDCNGVTALFFPVDGNLGPAKPARDPLIDAGLVDACHSSWDDPAGGLNEGGLMSVLLTPDFAESNRLYLSWSVPGTYDAATHTGEWRIATFVLDPTTNKLDLDSEEHIWSTRVEWDEFAHYGFALEWLPDGTILVSIGDDTRYTASGGGYGPRDWRYDPDNAEVTAQNPANHRGKLIRMMPDGSVPDGVAALPDGSVPAANPFIGKSMDNPYICLSRTFDRGGDGKFDPFTQTCPDAGWPSIEYDPYIYTMGWKQPWRGAILPNGAAVYGEVAPDAGADHPQRGRAGREEINYVPAGGGTNYGWPRCIGSSQTSGNPGDTYGYGHINWATGEHFGQLSCDGFEEAIIWYGGSSGNPWPAMGTGGAKTSEPLVFYGEDVTGPLRLPAQLNNTVLMTEWNRNWLLGVPVDDNYQLVTRDSAGNPSDSAWMRVTGISGWTGVLDAEIGPDGAVYAVKHGNQYRNNTGSQVIRIRCAECSDGLYGTNNARVVAGVSDTGATPAVRIALLVGLMIAAFAGRRRRKALV